MKKSVFIFLLFLFITSELFSQSNLQASAKTDIELSPDIMAKFPGGMNAMYKYFNDNIAFRSDETEAGISGELVMTYIVDTFGKISEFELKKGVNSNINSEITRILKSMPAWIPAQSDGQVVNSKYSIFLMIDATKRSVEPMFN